MDILNRLQALVGHVQTADASETPLNLVHISRELVTITHQLGALLDAVGLFSKPAAEAGAVVDQVAAMAGAVVDAAAAAGGQVTQQPAA